MIKLTSALRCMLFATLFVSSTASAITIDFQDGDRSLVRTFQGPDACIDQLSVINDGFLFDNPRNCGAYTLRADDDMGLYFATGAGEGTPQLSMTQLNGGEFDLLSFDFLRGAESRIEVSGYLDGQLQYSATDALGNLFEKNVTLDWFGIDEVVFTNSSRNFNSIGIDNLVVNAVPVPAAVWLFGSGLGLLGWMRRKATV